MYWNLVFEAIFLTLLFHILQVDWDLENINLNGVWVYDYKQGSGSFQISLLLHIIIIYDLNREKS